MATPAQITANRLNAQKSTGPCSVEGKAVSRFNALKHAASAKSLVIPGEDETALADLAASYDEQFHPVGPEEALLVEKIVAADWTLRRMLRLEAQVFNTLIAQQADSEASPIGAAYLQDCRGAKAFQKIFRTREAASRDWYRALAELRERQAERLAFEQLTIIPETPTVARPPQAPDLSPQLPPRGQIGFVFDRATPPAWRLYF